MKANQIHKVQANPRGQVLRAVRTLSCLKKIRIHYFLQAPIDPNELASRLDDVELSIDHFSHQIPNASDHFRINMKGILSASGAIGSLRMVVTFSKIGIDNIEPIIQDFESKVEVTLNKTQCTD